MKYFLRAGFAFCCLATVAFSQTLDTLTFGNASSESLHSLNYTYSDTFTGAFSQTARRLLPKPQHDVYGGEMAFAIAVDPVQQNFLTIKLWGSDTNDPQQWLVLNINGLELGDRHGSYGGPNGLWFQSVSWATNTFIYRTVALPLHLTRGKTSVTLKIRSMGWMSYYDSGPYFNHYQKLMDAPTVGIYRAYTHLGSGLDTSGETQGSVPSFPTPRALENETTVLNGIKANVNNALSSDLNATAASLDVFDIQFLAQCYDARENLGQTWITYPSGMTKTNLINQIIAGIDSEITAQSTNSAYITQQGNSSWGGYFGPLGDAIRLTWPQLSNSMSATVSFSGTYGTTTRQSGWSQGLRASIDYGRLSARRGVGNQAMYAADATYMANRGLQLVDPTNSIAESNAVRYIKEACGILPWSGNDQSGGTAQQPVPGIPPYGTNWFMCTTKGTSKDLEGFVGSDYGELGPWLYRLGVIAGDAQIKARGIVLSQARDVFRFPAADDAGYLVMQGTEPVGDRNNGLPGHYVYLGHGGSDDILMVSQGAGVVGNDIVGYLQQQMNDGQLLRMISGSTDPYLPMRYTTIKGFGQTGVKLPMSIGGADYAWCDEENMVFGARHGEERIFANLFWSSSDRITGWAKVFLLTTNQARLADVISADVSFRSTGQMFMGSPLLEGFSYDTPPDNPVNAMFALPLLGAWRSDLTNLPPTNRDGGRGTGYTFRYGNWLVGINANYATNLLGQPGSNYVVQLPASATNLIDGTVYNAPVVLPPKTSVVFYLPTNRATDIAPSRSLFLAAQAGNGRVALKWNDADGATTYNVKRSTTSGSGYTTIASGVTNHCLTDASVVNGTTYYYVVTGTNSAGEGGYSPEDSATPVAPQTAGLPAPWGNTNFTATATSASVSSGTFSVTSPAGDIWGTADGCQFVYQPLIGDGMVTAQVTGSSSANTYAKAGLMIRASLDANSVMAAIDMQRVAGRAEMGYRGGTGGSCSLFTSATGLTLPYWVRLQRSAFTVTSYISPDGTNWTQVGSVWLGNLPYVAYVGLCASPANGSAGQTTTATFKNVAFPLGAGALPSVPSGLTAAGANLAAVLNWTTVTNAATYNVKRSLSAAGPFTNVATGVVSPPYTDYGLNNNTNYYYVVTAVNEQGESAATSSTSAIPVPPPALTTNVIAAGSNTVINVSWAAVPGANSYNVYRAPYSSSTLQFTLLTNVLLTSFADGAVTTNTPYFYYVTSLTNASESAWSAMVAAVAPGVPSPWTTRDIGAPDMPGYAFQTNGIFNLNAAGNDIWGTSDQLNFTFQTVTPNCDIRARVFDIESTSAWAKGGVMIRESLNASSPYVICYLTPVSGTTQNGVVFQQRNTAGASSTQIAQTSGLVAPYWVRLTRTNSTFTAYNSADGTNWTSMGATSVSMNGTAYAGLALCANLNNSINTTLMDQVAVQPGTPAVPTGLFAIPGNTQVALIWNASSGATSYNVKRSLVSGSGYVTVTNVTGTNIVDIGLTNGTTYYYVVSALNGGESTNSVQVSATPSLITGPPSAPLNLTATPGDGRITLNWNAVNGAFGYNVKRSTTSGAEVLIGTSGFTNYVDTAVSVGKTYYYVVSGTNNFGDGTNSTEASATVQYITLVWSGATNGVWNTTTSNWLANGSAATYQSGFPVRFDDSALSNFNITVSATVSPASMIVSNNFQAYTYSSSAICGTNSLYKCGGGTLTLASSNSYSGGTVLAEGTLLAPNANALGTGLITLAGGTWLFTNNVTVTNNIVVQSNTTTAINESTYAASMILSGNLSGNGNLTTTAGTSFGGLQLSGNNSGYSGTLTVNNSGSQRFRILSATAGSSNAVWVLNNNTTDGQSANFGNGTLYFGALSGYGQFRQDTTGTTTLEIGALGLDSVFSGLLYQAGSGSILAVNKVGSGTLTLSGADSYAGQSVVKQGRLLVTQAFTGNGGFAVSNNATLGFANNFSSSAAALGALTLASGAALEFQNVSNLTAALASASTVTVNSNCPVLITGTNYLAAGNTYPLLNFSGSFSGFTNLQLQMPYGWRGALTNSGSQVLLANVAVVSTAPVSLNVTNTGAQMTFAWPVDHTGWRLQMQTNLTGTNWTDVSARFTNQISIPIVLTNRNAFYRLTYP